MLTNEAQFNVVKKRIVLNNTEKTLLQQQLVNQCHVRRLLEVVKEIMVQT